MPQLKAMIKEVWNSLKNDDFSVRAVRVSDKEAIVAHLMALGDKGIASRFGFPASEYQVIQYTDKIDFDNDILVGLFKDEEMLGFAHGATCVNESEEVTELGISISPELHGQGWGSKLTDEIIKKASAHGSRKLIFFTSVKNHAIRKIVEKHHATTTTDCGDLTAVVPLEWKRSKIRRMFSRLKN